MSPNEARQLRVGDLVQLKHSHFSPVFEVTKCMEHGVLRVKQAFVDDERFAGRAAVTFYQIDRKVEGEQESDEAGEVVAHATLLLDGQDLEMRWPDLASYWRAGLFCARCRDEITRDLNKALFAAAGWAAHVRSEDLVNTEAWPLA